MDRLFFDTNILLDVLERRAPWFPDALNCMARVREGRCAGAMTVLSLSDLAYIQRGSPVKVVYKAFERLAEFLEIAPLDAGSVRVAFAAGLNDIEDGFQYGAAVGWHATHLLTRNLGDFAGCAGVRVMMPSDYLSPE